MSDEQDMTGQQAEAAPDQGAAEASPEQRSEAAEAWRQWWSSSTPSATPLASG